jgi:hypothetical protein
MCIAGGTALMADEAAMFQPGDRAPCFAMSGPIAHTFRMANSDSRPSGYPSPHNGLMFRTVVLFFAVFIAHATAKDIVLNYNDGSPHFRYQVDAKNQKYGPFEELTPKGKLKVRGNYLADKKTGAWIVYGDNGKSQEQLTYRNDQLEGPYRYNFPSGLPQEVTAYHQDDFAGPITVNDEKGHVLRTITYPQRYDAIEQAWDSYYPKTRGPVRFTDEPKVKAPYESGRIAMEDEQAGLKYLMLYRFLSGLPFEKMTIVPTLIDRAQDGAVLLAKLGTLTQEPDQPRDMDDAFFKMAYAGCSESNQFKGGQNLFDAIDSFMDDSDDASVKDIIHRIGVLNPALERTGFGCCANFITQYTANGRGPAFTFYAYPGPGYYPRKLLQKDAAWSVHFAGNKVRLGSADALSVHITPLDDHFAGSETVTAEIVGTHDGNVTRVIIFRTKLKSLAGARYYVDISGLRSPSGASIPFSYLVDLQDMPEAEVKNVATTKAAITKIATTKPVTPGKP